MKLKVPVLGQRVLPWSNITLGYNPSTAVDAFKNPYNIYWYGCLITSLGMLCGKNPDEVNEILRQGNGFQKGTGNFIWSKSTLLGLTEKYVSPTWDGPVTDTGIQRAKEFLDQGFPLVARIDFNPATDGEEMHFLVITGYENDIFLCNDPWTNDKTTLEKYGGFKRTVIQYRVYDKRFPVASEEQPQVPPDLQKMIDDLRAERDKNWNLYTAEKQTKEELIREKDSLEKEKDSLWKAVEQSCQLLGIPVSTEKMLGQIQLLVDVEDEYRKEKERANNLDIEKAKCLNDKAGFETGLMIVSSERDDLKKDLQKRDDTIVGLKAEIKTYQNHLNSVILFTIFGLTISKIKKKPTNET